MKNLENQKGIIKEIVVVVLVIFILAYFNIDPTDAWDKIIEYWDKFIELFKS